MHIITFCSHVPYLYLLAPLKLKVDVVQLAGNRRFLQSWKPSIRPLPEGWQLIDWDTGKRQLAAGKYQAALAHNINDYIDFIRYSIPRYLIMHTSLTGRLFEEKTSIDKVAYLRNYTELISRSGGKIVYISDSKKKDWGLPGDVIYHGIPEGDYGGYTGEDPSILRVANNLVERGDILDLAAHLKLTDGLPLCLVGKNPKVPESQPADSWEALKQHYRQHRVYLHTAREGLEDGFNLGMLEAMATGMPIVSTAHSTSPIVDGQNGFISSDLVYLRERIEALLADRELAMRLGQAARETVLKRFALETFKEKWLSLFG